MSFSTAGPPSNTVPTAHPSPQPKRHLDQLSRFRTGDSILRWDAPFPAQNCPFPWGHLDPHLIHDSLGPPVFNPNECVFGVKLSDEDIADFGVLRTLPWQPFFWLSTYGVHIGATWRMRLNRACAAAMRPYVKLLWPLVKVLTVITSQNELKFFVIITAKFCTGVYLLIYLINCILLHGLTLHCSSEYFAQSIIHAIKGRKQTLSNASRTRRTDLKAAKLSTNRWWIQNY